MTTEKPDPAALIAKLQQIVDMDPSDEHVRRECFMSNPPQHVAVVACQRIAREVIAGLAALTPQAPTPTAADAAVLDELLSAYVSKLTNANSPTPDDVEGSEDWFEEARAAVLARMAGGPPGYKLVPVEPTEAMLVAGVEAAPMPLLHKPRVRESISTTELAECYRVMLAAAPTEVK